MLTTAPKLKPPQQKSSPTSTSNGLVTARSNTRVDYGAPPTGRFAHDFSRIPVHAPPPITLQAKLSVNTPGDTYEQEADHLAEKVMSMPEPQLQRACACGGDCAKCQTTQSSQDPPRLQTKSVGSSASAQTEAPPIVHEVLASPGQPLDAATRAFVEPRFGHDFSHVRVHTDASASQSAREVNAHAYTAGHNIVFGAGRFAPETQEGRRLLSHELTHVVQQRGTGPLLQRAPNQKVDSVVSADLVREIKRDNETWTMTIENATNPDSLGRLIWLSRVPPGVIITLTVAITEPFERGWFTLEGVTFDTLKTMEPSFAKLFSENGVEDETKESAAVQEARAAFRDRHDGYTEEELDRFDTALRKVTKRNPDLLVAYYDYYSQNNLRDEGHWNDHIDDFDPAKDAGRTNYGGTRLNRDVVTLTSNFPTDSHISLLAGTLIHEYVHTSQGGGNTGVDRAPGEAKAYGIEKFFSERMGDKQRADFIAGMSWTSSVDIATHANLIFEQSYRTITELYKIIDQGGPAAKEARAMTVDFISNNAADYGPTLKAFIATLP